MAITISVFNNKGGVGKTTYLYHIAHLLARRQRRVLLVDCDSQCNLTAYAMPDAAVERSWEEKGNSIWRAIEPVHRILGDIRQRSPSCPKEDKYPTLFIVPGDLLLSEFEDNLGNTWNGAKGGSEPNLRVQSAISRYMNWAADKVSADVVFVDLGPNLGALNRAVLSASDYFVVPVAPDLFSIRGTENLGTKLQTWREEWNQANAAWKGTGLDLPQGKPVFLGYVIQQHNIRHAGEDGMTKGWGLFGGRLEEAIQKNIVDKLLPLGQAKSLANGKYKLGNIPNLHSLIPYSLEARKPVFDCTSVDGLKGAHITAARDSVNHFTQIVDRIDTVITEEISAV